MTELLMEPMYNFADTAFVREVNALLRRATVFVPSTSVTFEAESATVSRGSADSWFWSHSWQAGEQEVDAHVAAGRLSVFEDVDSFLSHLDEIDPAE